MADEVFEIAFETTGDASAAKAFEEIKLKQFDLQKQARELSKQLRQLEKAGQDNGEEYAKLAREYVRTKASASELGREAGKLSRELRSQGAAAQAQTRHVQVASRVTESFSEVTMTGGQRMGEYAGALGNIGAVFGTVNPQMGQAGSLIGAIGSAASASTAAFGPMGLAVGVVTAGLGILIPVLQETEEELQDVSREAETAAERTRSLAEALERRDRDDRLFSGIGAEVSEIEEAVTEARDAIEGLRRERDEVLNQGGSYLRRAIEAELGERAAGGQAGLQYGERAAEGADAILRIDQDMITQRERLANLTRGLEVARAAEAQEAERTAAADAEAAQVARLRQQAEERRERERERRRSGSRGAQDHLREEEQLAAAQKAMDADIAAKRVDAERAAAEEIRRVREELAGWTRELEDRQAAYRVQVAQNTARMQLNSFNTALNQRAAAFRQERDDQAALAQRMEDDWKAFRGSVVNEALAPVTALAGKVLQQLQAGSEMTGDAFVAMLDQFLEATAIEYSIKALGEFANAAAAAARQDWARVPLHLSAGGLAAGVAAATGIAGAAIQSPAIPGGSGGGGGDVTQPSPASQGAPMAPLTVNLYAHNAVWTRAEQGQTIREIERVTRREMGRG